MLFDVTPITLQGFKLRARSVVAVGSPTPSQWQAAMSFANASEESATYWVGDLLAYAESREDWKDKLDQITDVTGYAHQTILNMTYVARHVDEAERIIAPSFSHAKEVAALPKPEQRKWLKKARERKWTRREMRQEMRISNRSKIIEGQAALEGMYRVILADPPWSYRNNRPTDDGSMTRAEEHYPAMSIDDLCKLPVAAHAMPNAVLFMWVTATVLYDNPGPREVIEAWGFRPVTGYVWDKVLGMPGNYSYVKHEHLIVAVRGQGSPDVQIDGTKHDSIQVIRRSGMHSEKPAEFRKLIESLYTTGPYLELFAREKVEGWTGFGNDARLWAHEATK